MTPQPIPLLNRSIRNALDQVNHIFETRELFLAFIKPKHCEPLEQMDLQAFIDPIISEFGLQLSDVKICLEPQHGSGMVPVPRTAVRIALRSVLQNAIEATYGRLNRKIAVSIDIPARGKSATDSQPVHGMVRVQVTDNGPGASAAMVPQLFQLGATTKAKGAGLGLFTSRKLMQSVGGDIVYDSAYSAGARFVITFPAQ
jgi:signal transduction histidine kinase